MQHIPDAVDTPTILVDVDTLTRNIERMAAAMRSKRIRLRPHAKTHKIPEIAALQIEAGAAGLTVATIGEAEVFARNGVRDIFVAYPLWVGERAATRLRALTAAAKITVGVDSAEAAAAMGAALGNAAGDIEALVEIDSGHHRSGVLPEESLAVATAARDAGLRVTGVFTFPGHSYAPGMPVRAAADESSALLTASTQLRDLGFDIVHLSGGSTPTATLTEPSAVTEARPGVYVFGDAQQLELGRCAADDIALTVASTVVSRHDGQSRRIVLDAGSKVLGGDRPAWTTGFERLLDHPDARITALSEHHATVVWPSDDPLPALGSRVRVVPNHVCVAVNLVDDVVVTSKGEVVDRWAVAAQGRNS
jgi:D-serine deaminase-like pyridoxal phosphate-dependent protein